MSDERALTWTNLFPPDLGYTSLGAPPAFSELLEVAGFRQGPDVLWLWDAGLTDFSGLDFQRFHVLALVNPRRISFKMLKDCGFERLRCYAVLPSLADARWFVPQDNSAIAAATLRMYAPYRMTARVNKAAALLAMRLRLPIRKGDRLVIAARMPFPLEQIAAKPFKYSEVRLAFSSGTPGPARKPTVQIFSLDGEVLGYAKLGVTGLAASLVRNEAGILRSLTASAMTTNRIPQLLLEADIGGKPVTIQSPLAGKYGPLRLSSIHFRFLAALQKSIAQPVTVSDIFRDAAVCVGRFAETLPLLRQSLRQVSAPLTDLNLPITVTHGDFAPWNIRAQGQELGVFDWEYATLNGLPLLDQWRHALQVGFLLGGWSTQQALQYLQSQQLRNLLGLPPSQISALQSLHLIHLCCQRLAEGYAPTEQLSGCYLSLLSALTATQPGAGSRQ